MSNISWFRDNKNEIIRVLIDDVEIDQIPFDNLSSNSQQLKQDDTYLRIKLFEFLGLEPTLERAENDTPVSTEEKSVLLERINCKRADPRINLNAQAFVSIPPLTTKLFNSTEISRGGMFLAFKDSSSTLNEMEHRGIDIGNSVEINFSVTLKEKIHRIQVRAKIVHFTPKGIGVEFVTHNPPQLAEINDLFSISCSN